MLQVMQPVAAGALVGAALGYAMLRRIAASFHGVEALDPSAWAAALVLGAAALVAVLVPSRGALAVDPARVLQDD